MSNINPINFGVAGNPYLKQQAEKDLAQQTEQQTKPEENQNKQPVQGDALSFMATQNAAFVKPAMPKTVNVAELIAKYNTTEQQERIAGFITDLMANIDEKSEAAQSEFGVSQAVGDSIALANIDANGVA